ncbi:RluA family pseudouridine synthase [Marinoscillum furvescens]|uniref:RluA family pseudouridine synthase n=1 Tax=Marinoscillum furvescens DSM 4134 TaxID=1122208 RepID=A0A3D9KYZ5_MARFU|nr:RNA pseudouridine synthase [Marinoscillum furvescens]RED92808.1 RluA family pseudouridine synthase [Marinoscillum furvescens DSM 4134]
MHKYVKGITLKELILFENDNYLVINKPPYISTLEDRNDPIDILKLAKEHHPDAQVCHRLDKETSGALVIAKHNDAYRHFAIMLEKRQVKKVYHAVIAGIHEFDNLEADQPILPSNSKSRIDFRAGKPSLTLVSTLETFRAHTLIKCFPVTGRLHQIRVHLAFHDAPICGDPAYGGDFVYLSQLKRNFNLSKNTEQERPIIPRVALHAHDIAFRDLNEEIIEVAAPYPKDFAVLVKQLRKYL